MGRRFTTGGGATEIFGPDGSTVTGPLGENEEGILFANLNLGLIPLAKMAHDPTGHYSPRRRPRGLRWRCGRARSTGYWATSRTRTIGTSAVTNLSTGINRHQSFFVQTGLRVSELTQLCRGDAPLGTGAHLRCKGKGRKERISPLTSQTASVVRVWLVAKHGPPTDPLFPVSHGCPLSRDAVERLLAKYAAIERTCPTLKGKGLSPHAVRHTSAMRLLHAGVDTTVIALWHEA